MRMKMIIVVAFLIIAVAVIAINIPVIKSPNEINNRTYIIGTHEITSKIALTTERIRIASETIKNDTTIYYKNAWGNWINATTGESVAVPIYFTITHTDMEAHDER